MMIQSSKTFIKQRGARKSKLGVWYEAPTAGQSRQNGQPSTWGAGSMVEIQLQFLTPWELSYLAWDKDVCPSSPLGEMEMISLPYFISLLCLRALSNKVRGDESTETSQRHPAEVPSTSKLPGFAWCFCRCDMKPVRWSPVGEIQVVILNTVPFLFQVLRLSGVLHQMGSGSPKDQTSATALLPGSTTSLRR